MILYSIQTEKAWQKAIKTGVLYGDKRFVWADFKLPYSWLMEQMNTKIGKSNRTTPVWAWYKNNDKMPDLRESGHLEKGTKGVRLKIEIADKYVLLSDFDLWHMVLTPGHIPKSKADDKRWDILWETNKIEYFEKCKETWFRIFEFNKFANTYYGDGKYIQATMWEVPIKCVKKVDYFIAR